MPQLRLTTEVAFDLSVFFLLSYPSVATLPTNPLSGFWLFRGRGCAEASVGIVFFPAGDTGARLLQRGRGSSAVDPLVLSAHHTVPQTSIVQACFDPNPTPKHCHHESRVFAALAKRAGKQQRSLKHVYSSRHSFGHCSDHST